MADPSEPETQNKQILGYSSLGAFLLWSGEISQACSRLKRNLLSLSFAYLSHFPGPASPWTQSRKTELSECGGKHQERALAYFSHCWLCPVTRGPPSSAAWLPGGCTCVLGPKPCADKGFESASPWPQHMYLGPEAEHSWATSFSQTYSTSAEPIIILPFCKTLLWWNELLWEKMSWRPSKNVKWKSWILNSSNLRFLVY